MKDLSSPPPRKFEWDGTGRVPSVSLGYNCWSASCGVFAGLRGRKRDGNYRTCPFDLLLGPYEGVARCLEEGIDRMYDPALLRLVRAPGGRDPRTGNLRSCVNPNTEDGSLALVNVRYGFVFSHESPDSLHMPENENWAGGVLHFVDDGYRRFVERYRARCDNLRAYVREAAEKGLPMHFTVSVPCMKPGGPLAHVGLEAHRLLKDAVVRHLLPPGSPEPKFTLFEEENDDQYLADAELIDVVLQFGQQVDAC
jgi:hypothetical protein